ncbi:MAG: hypothetical protein AAF614_20585 [Chloroflexota bacterium]
MNQITSLILVMLLFAKSVAAQPTITPSLTTQTSTANVGDEIVLELEVVHPTGYRVLPPELGETWGPFEVWRRSPWVVERNGDGSETSRMSLTVTLWEVGDFTTPDLMLRVSSDVGEIVETTAVSTPITIESVLQVDDAELRDIKPQAALPLPPTWPWVAGGLVAVGMFGWLLWRRVRGRETAVLPPEDPRSPTEIILEDLDRVVALELPQQERYKEHYTYVTDQLRRYLTDVHDIDAVDMTTLEIREAIKTLNRFKHRHRSDLVSLLRIADWVKFADLVPSQTEANDFPQRIRELIIDTSPMEKPVPFEELNR